MKTVQSVLFATDHTPGSQEALKVVSRLANAFGAQLHVLHVIEPLWHFNSAAVQHLFYRQEQRRAQKLLDAVQTQLQVDHVKVGQCQFVLGSVVDSIASTATALEAELIVLGAGNIAANRTVGITAQAVMEHAEQPVLVIHPGSPTLELKTILCPIDHSSVSRRGLRNAIRLAKSLGSDLIVLSVIPEVSWLTAAAEIGEVTNVKEEYAASWAEELDRFLAGIDFNGVAHKLELERGVSHEQILAAAKKYSADLIVMGATGRSGLVRILLGSTTRRVLRDLPCSLLTVRQQDEVGQDVIDDTSGY